MKTTIFSLITALIMFVIVEAGAAAVLFHSGQLQGRNAARFDYSEGRLATMVFVRKLMGRFTPSNNLDITSEPERTFRPDPELGYDFVPGHSVISTRLRRTGRVHEQSQTILEDGGRATSYVPVEADRGIWIFGDSVIYGATNPDEHSLAWLLQARFPQVRVHNLATSGHGNVQALLRLRRRAAEVGPDDILIFGYADYLNHRNTRSPSLVDIYSAEVFEELYPGGLQLPLASLEGGDLKIEMVPMTCEGQEDWCAAGDPPFAEQAQVTRAILEVFAATTPATTVLAYVEGADDDPVIAAAREMGITVADLRPDPMKNQSDDFYPFDTHPGALSHYYFFRKLTKMLTGAGLLEPPGR